MRPRTGQEACESQPLGHPQAGPSPPLGTAGPDPHRGGSPGFPLCLLGPQGGTEPSRPRRSIKGWQTRPSNSVTRALMLGIYQLPTPADATEAIPGLGNPRSVHHVVDCWPQKSHDASATESQGIRTIWHFKTTHLRVVCDLAEGFSYKLMMDLGFGGEG